MEDDFRTLQAMVETSNEAHWGIVFLEPVDTTLPKSEVIRQVFENQSVWRMCNPAMARIYQLPESVDFNEQDVRLYWPRSAANEKFVDEIIKSNYAINDALSVDRRHDGTLQYILNDVRADIVDGFLLRLWGNCRDITEQRNADDEKANALKLAIRALDGMPDPVIVLDAEGKVINRNKAFAAAFSGSRTVESQLLAYVRTRKRASGWSLFTNPGGPGPSVLLDVHIRQITGMDDKAWTVITVREREAHAPKRASRQPKRP
jgi:PAS domain-containing protein